jgi:hypothetical protein
MSEVRSEGVMAARGPVPGCRPQSKKRKMILERVDETVDQELNTDAVHAALAALLMRYHRTKRDRLATAGP